MKATRNAPELEGDFYSYWLQGHNRYEKLRNTNREICRILAVLFLPQDEKNWLEHSEQQLILRRCVYWAYLGGAPPVTTSSGARVTLPQDQSFSPENLRALMLDRSYGRFTVFRP